MKNKTLIFAKDKTELQYLVAQAPGLLRQGTLVTGDLVTADEAERQGLDYIDEWDYLEPGEIERNCEIASTLINSWWDERLASTVCHGVSLAQATGLDLFMPFEIALNARCAYERILREHLPGKVCMFTRPQAGIMRHRPIPIAGAAGAVADAVLRWCLERAGIAFDFLPQQDVISGHVKQWKPNPFPARFQPPLKDWPREKPTILLWNTMLPREAHSLEQALNTRDDCQAVRVFDIVENTLACHAWEDAPTTAKLKAAWQAFEKSTREYAGPHPEIFGNPHLAFQFERTWQEMRCAAQLCEPFAALLDAVRPSLLALGHDCYAIERALEGLCKQRGIPVVSLFYGGFAHAASFIGATGDAGRILVWGDISPTSTELRVPQDRIKIVGCLRYENQYRLFLNKNTAGAEDQVRARLKLKLRPHAPVVLLPTVNVTYCGFSCAMAHTGRHRRTWREIVEWAGRHPELTVLIKPHPSYDYYDFYRRLSENGPPNLVYLETADLSSVLAAADLAVLINCATTAGLEAMLHGVPVIFLKQATYPLPSRQDAFGGKGISIAESVAELEQIAARLLTDAAGRQQALDEAAATLRLVMGDGQRPALERIIDEVLAEMQQAPPQSGPAGDGETEVWRLAGQALRQLASGAGKDFTASWKNAVALAAAQANPEPLLRRMLFAASLLIGVTARDAKSLRRLVRQSQKIMDEKARLSASDRWMAWINAYETAVSRYKDTGGGPHPLALSLAACWDFRGTNSTHWRWRVLRALYDEVSKLAPAPFMSAINGLLRHLHAYNKPVTLPARRWGESEPLPPAKAGLNPDSHAG